MLQHIEEQRGKWHASDWMPNTGWWILVAGGLQHNLLSCQRLRIGARFLNVFSGQGRFWLQVLRPGNQTEGPPRFEARLASRSKGLLASLRVTPGTVCKYIMVVLMSLWPSNF